MKKINIAIIGAGNISNTRHIPALRKIRNARIVGVLGVRKTNLERTQQKHGIKNILLLKQGAFAKQMASSRWFKDVDAVVIGAPPKEHFALVEAALLNDKHVLVEKPMTMNEKEADILITLAKEKNKIFSVMHNFQFAVGMQKLEKIIDRGELGKIVSFFEFQLTNKNRRLPEWYNDLPLGLFYDEAPHFMYLLERFGGKIKLEDAHAQFGPNKADSTPLLMSVSLKAGGIPTNIFLNFESPVCEWFFVVSGEKKIAFYDLFKDILIVLPTDNEHLAMDVLQNSRRATLQYWGGFIANGFKMATGNLLYGHETVLGKFVKAIASGEDIDPAINGQSGKSTITAMNDIVKMVKQNGKRK